MEQEQQTPRQRWMSVLARTDANALITHWEKLALRPQYQRVRAPEIGLAQVRARMGGTGNAFNLGDVTITRAVVRLESGELGYSYITGRNKQHAELAAVVDALMQTVAHDVLQHALISPLAAEKAEQEQQRAREVATSKVDFFTMVRGENE
ncbi:phosphonate C-P lyase system protein PhnG [Grimontia hollisae]|uniref:Phosphonate C-P lyase system protein PhnG n=1 Tax=Grimontia hollisae TaxID=673 RepID=A0A377J8R7_GRIHO|nr:phosphonate C-P lyase system protein PhnG [Grimontia hollisae]MDF2185048.1 phosphonate C-P lyase system protein PhnG [Grimontia hollisae]STO98196.1 phosphonate C-P lyase system protein PhnG [Grimontia hollisae]STQ75989.1 phosphonate C-P lyase system protein PhnG [Grimontia hollisae]